MRAMVSATALFPWKWLLYQKYFLYCINYCILEFLILQFAYFTHFQVHKSVTLSCEACNTPRLLFACATFELNLIALKLEI